MDNLKHSDDNKITNTTLNSILKLLYKLRRSLRWAYFWGIFDFIGGGIIINSIKQSRLEKAKSIAFLINEELTRLREQDKNVQHLKNVEIQFDKSLLFVDFWSRGIGGLLINSEVQEKIQSELNSVNYYIKNIIDNNY